MSSDDTSLPERVAGYFSKLSAAARDLNSISDELGKSIAEIDFALKRLNLGVVVWVPIRKSDGRPIESWYWSEDIGYSKIGANWGVSLRKVSGDFNSSDDAQVESWLFNDAPRTLRVSAIEKIPDLLEKLSDEAAKTTEKIRARLSEAQVVAEAVKTAAGRPPSPPRARLMGSDASGTLLATKPLDIDMAISSGISSLGSMRNAVANALARDGHSSAAQLLGSGEWTVDGDSLRIEVALMSKKMLSLTVNAAAEKIIRQELARLGGPLRFMVIPGASVGTISAEGMEK